MKWETVIGLEVHAELATRSKIFCGCSTAFGYEPNTQVCPVCAGMPGALPVLNRAALDCAVKTGLALGCAITRRGKFDRKNYFYPDLPKAYQVSQLYEPICQDGGLDIETAAGGKRIRIREIHMEEDAGKLIHDPRGGTHMDYNRCGVPLLEIVSQPDFADGDEVLAYLEKLREILLFLGVCDGKMQEGSLRADVNLSLRPAGGELGVRTETKNLNSFKAIGRAIAYEIERQTEILEGGGCVVQETRRWDDDRGLSYGMRAKENAQEYRYFPEPDLLPMVVDDAWLAAARASLPELPHEKRARYISAFGLSKQETAVLTAHPNVAALFENAAEKSGEPTEAAHLVSGLLMQLMKQHNTPPEALTTDGGKLAALITLVTGQKISRGAYKEAAEAVFLHDADPGAYIAEKGLLMETNADAAADTVAEVLAENPSAVADYRAGKEKAFSFLMGQVMKKLGGAGNPGMAKKALRDRLDAPS